jgi:hypothetical protein
MTGPEKRRLRRRINGQLLTPAPTRVWHPAVIRLVHQRSGFDSTLRIVEPQQSASEIVRRVFSAWIARREEILARPIGAAASMGVSDQRHLCTDGRTCSTPAARPAVRPRQ